MNGQPCRRIDESAWEDGPPPIPEIGSPSRAPASATRRRRSSADTMPVSDPFSALQAGRPDWCVDLGPTLQTMTTFELWAAVERGEVAPRMRVWREGLECWTPVRDLPELQWAVSSALASPPEVTAAPGAMLPLDDTLHLDAAPELTPTGPLSGLAKTPAPEPSAPVAKRPLSERPARAVSRPRETTHAPVSLPHEKRRGARWLFAGSAVASLAIATALFGTVDAPATPVSDPAPAVVAIRPGAPATLSPAAPALAAPPSAAPIAPVDPPDTAEAPLDDAPPSAHLPAVHREERGQRRLPRGGRRTSGQKAPTAVYGR